MKRYNKYIKNVFILLLFILLLPITVNAACPLGEKTTADLAGILKIMKIAAPLIVIAYTIIDGIKALVKQNIDAESKKLYAKFVKRLVAALFLFVIPVLVDVLMQVMNVWDGTGHCVIDDTGSSSSSCLSECSKISQQSARAACEAKCNSGGSGGGGLEYTPSVDADGIVVITPNVDAGDLNYNKSADAGDLNYNKNADAGDLNYNKNADAGNLNDKKNADAGNLNDKKNVNAGDTNNPQDASADDITPPTPPVVVIR